MKLLGTGPGASRISSILSQDTPDEGLCLQRAHQTLSKAKQHHPQIAQLARGWILDIRQHKPKRSSLAGLLQAFPLHSETGLALMRLSECYLRCPDNSTRARLITELIGPLSDSKQMPRALRALLRAMVRVQSHQGQDTNSWLERLADPLIQKTVEKAIQKTGQEFLSGQTIEEALSRADKTRQTHSFDMLGEGARTRAQAQSHFMAYLQAAQTLATQRKPSNSLHDNHSLSIKLSALCPRFEDRKRATELPGLVDKVFELAMACLPNRIALTLDAEENSRLLFTLEVLEAVAARLQIAKRNDPTLEVQGLGVAVQAYNRRSLAVIDHLIEWAGEHCPGLQVRLVKGAYWDTEIAQAQREGLESFPVFTRKEATDLNYLACAKKLLQARGTVYPMLATHNAYTLAAVLTYANADSQKGLSGFECQRLFGMGVALWQVLAKDPTFANVPCRTYAPVGAHDTALAYLVRRLLENGANTSFVNAVHDLAVPVESLLACPIKACENLLFTPNPGIRPAAQLFPTRGNSRGIDLSNREVQIWLHSQVELVGQHLSNEQQGPSGPIELGQQFQVCKAAQQQWAKMPVQDRAEKLTAWANQLDKHRGELIGLLVHEAGKTWADAIAELREGMDFLLQHSALGLQLFSQAQTLPGPAGELNQLEWHPRGVCLCISPWNFPLAIWIGQVSACLIGGNGVLAKAAPQTQNMASRLLQLAQQAGLPPGLIQNLGPNTEWTQKAIAELPIQGVFFTGSNATAKQIALALAQRPGPLVPLVAETGGVNCMVVDSTALLEQACDAIVQSAFGSAGQRCSALRVVYVQADISEPLLRLVRGAIELLALNEKPTLDTDLGPLIDKSAFEKLNQGLQHFGLPTQSIANAGKPLFKPEIVQSNTPGDLGQEWFGPLLQWLVFDSHDIQSVYSAIAASGWGLTFGLQSRLPSRMREASQLPVGNVYINRPMTGAVVGSQPFGGQGLSGTGPKAGSADLLLRSMTQHTTSNNTASVGGIVELLNQNAQD